MRSTVTCRTPGPAILQSPETGISIGQLERILKARFGHDQHIDGDLVKTKTGELALTVRGTSIVPKTFTDGTGDVGKLLTQAGEYFYGQSQPGLWAAYLSNNDRNEEAIRFAQAAYATADPSEGPYVLNYWANAISATGREGAMGEALRLWREALRLKPDYGVGYNNIMFALAGLGDEEGSVRVGEAAQSRRRTARASARGGVRKLRLYGLGPAGHGREQYRRPGISRRHRNDDQCRGRRKSRRRAA
jgi:tetratricopeptide (TPR) repeat protein